MGLSLYVAPSVKEPEKMGRTIAGAVLVTGIFTGLFLLVSLFAFGEAGLRTLDWPVITLMSSALLPGGFFQRWDAIFTSLLLAGILPGVGAGIFYLGILSKNLFFRKVSYRKLCGVVAVLLLMVCLLTGCAGRELEDRAFPTVLAAENDTFPRQLEKYQKESARLVDYSHVKAILFSQEAITDEKIREEILKFLEADPAFARNILIYIGDEEALSLVRGAEEETILSGTGETSKEDLGLYLEDLANTQEESLTLGGLLYGIHNGGISLEIPGLQVQDGILVPGEKLYTLPDSGNP
jgi:hypothetical protein